MTKIAERVILGNIYTVDKNQPKAEAVAIAGGKFIYVGDEAGVKEYIGPSTLPMSGCCVPWSAASGYN